MHFSSALNLQDVAAAVTALLTLAGIILIVLQLRQIRTSIQAASHAAIYERASDFRRLFVDRPDLRPYFFSGAKIDLRSADRARVESIAEIYLNYLEHIYLVADALGAENRRSLDNFLTWSLHSSPIAVEVLRDRPCVYSQTFRTYALRLADTPGGC